MLTSPTSIVTQKSLTLVYNVVPGPLFCLCKHTIHFHAVGNMIDQEAVGNTIDQEAVGNKIDQEAKRKVTTEDAIKAASRLGVDYIEASSLKNINIEKVSIQW